MEISRNWNILSMPRPLWSVHFAEPRMRGNGRCQLSGAWALPRKCVSRHALLATMGLWRSPLGAHPSTCCYWACSGEISQRKCCGDHTHNLNWLDIYPLNMVFNRPLHFCFQQKGFGTPLPQEMWRNERSSDLPFCHWKNSNLSKEIKA